MTATRSLGTLLTDGTKEIVMAVSSGYGIRFKEDDVRPMGLVAAGVNGVKLGVGDEVTGAEVVPDKGELFVISSDGKAKRIPASDIPMQGRYGRGVIFWNLTKRHHTGRPGNRQAQQRGNYTFAQGCAEIY